MNFYLKFAYFIIFYYLCGGISDSLGMIKSGIYIPFDTFCCVQPHLLKIQRLRFGMFPKMQSGGRST